MVITKTRSELVSQVLSNLGVTEAGQAPSDEDASTVDGYVDTSLASLSARGIVLVMDDEEIPAEYFLPISILIASDCAHEFGAGLLVTPDNPNPVRKAETDLRVMVRGQSTREPLQTDYF